MFPDSQSEQEYNSLYPYKDEFQAWVDAIEADCEYFEQLVNPEELSIIESEYC